MEAVYNSISETDTVCALRNAAAVLWLQFTVHMMLFPTINVTSFYISTFRGIAYVQCPVWLFYIVACCRAFPLCCSDTF
jgi:hypothetical protein